MTCARALASFLALGCVRATPPPAPPPSTAPAPVVAASPAPPPRPAFTYLSSVRIEREGPAFTSLRGARFWVPDVSGAWRPMEPAVDGADRAQPTAQHRAASFIVDHDQPSLQAPCEGGALDADVVIARVDEMIPRKSMAVGFITASVVATRGEGDCTEHAVLAAAMLRCHGHAARLAGGVLVVRNGEDIIAGWHLWAERWDGGWRVADATRPERHGEVAHLRVFVLDDEGPAANRAMVRTFANWDVTRLRLTAAP